MRKQILFASHSHNKLVEMQRLFGDEYELIPLRCVTEDLPPAETSITYIGNALIKAEAAWKVCSGMPVLADDSGIEVAVLGGHPGVDTAHYPGVEHLLHEMADVEDRLAAMVCTLVLLRPSSMSFAVPEPVVVHSTTVGSISTEARGNYGFDYDTVFIPHTVNHRLNTLTFAEMEPDKKFIESPRARAVRLLKQMLYTG